MSLATNRRTGRRCNMWGEHCLPIACVGAAIADVVLDNGIVAAGLRLVGLHCRVSYLEGRPNVSVANGLRTN